MFGVELTAGILASSQALKADALDFLADSLTYALTLLMIGRPLRWRASAALVKGASLGVVALWVLGTTVHRMFNGDVPDQLVMGGIGLLALFANVTSALLLMRYRSGDANVRSVWLCSRNDAIGNVAVIAAAGLVFLTGTAWPDLAVALVMAALFLHSATGIIRQAVGELRQPPAARAHGHAHEPGQEHKRPTPAA
ncbi:MAG: cation transporter [Rhodospirillales bacterium]|nr:MAG: cation transporter [Rhodospirillales bacterium]